MTDPAGTPFDITPEAMPLEGSLKGLSTRNVQPSTAIASNTRVTGLSTTEFEFAITSDNW